MPNEYVPNSSNNSLLFFFLLILLITKDLPYCQSHPTSFLLFFLNLVVLFGVFYK